MVFGFLSSPTLVDHNSTPQPATHHQPSPPMTIRFDDSSSDAVDGPGLNAAASNSESSGCAEDGDEEELKLIQDESLKRLFELKLSAQEPQLSEDLITVNRQLQEDEMLALESIYAENVSILEDQNDMKRLVVHVHVQFSSGLRITAQFKSDTVDQRDGHTSDLSYSFPVSYLPPIILTCLLPLSYPSSSAPYFTISCQWLASCTISKLCSKLDSIWEEQSGHEILYNWVEWIHDDSLSYLGFIDNIALGPYDGQYQGDRRVISGSVSPEIDIPLLKSYNDERLHEEFCGTIQECPICFRNSLGSEFVKLSCQHFFCEECMRTFCHMHVQEGTVFKLKCPESKCEGMIPVGSFRRLLGKEEYERWETLTLQRTLEAMSDVVYCPRCETACLEDEEHHAQCSKCYHSFCTLCLDRRHVGVSCMTPEMKLTIFQERQNSTSIGSEQRRRERDIINQLLSIKEISGMSKLCPSCKMAISRTEGCNKIVCGNCGQYFCYRCNKAISGYEHFRDGGCELFPAEEIQRWEERNPRQVVAEIQALMFPDHSHRCPICAQRNLKVGNNNHIFCWACQSHYCYLCRKMVKRSSEHFGPKGCKQHTAG